MAGSSTWAMVSNMDQGVLRRRSSHARHPHESLEQAVIRETLEETAHDFTPTALIGMYMSRYVSARTGHDVTYLSFSFCGEVGAKHDQPLDDGILRAIWMSYDEIVACKDKHRSPSVLARVDDYLAGKRSPLSLLQTDPSVYEVIGG